MIPLFIFGAGGHGKVTLDAARSLNLYGPIRFLDDDHAKHGRMVCGSAVVGGFSRLEELAPDSTAVFVALGDNPLRVRLIDSLLERGFKVPALVHARAYVAPTAVLSPGVAVMAQAAVNPDARIGLGAIINTGATVDHDCRIGRGVHLSPGVHLSGTVIVEDYAHLGTGASVLPGLRIGEGAVLGAGAVAVKDIPQKTLALGIPAAVVKSL